MNIDKKIKELKRRVPLWAVNALYLAILLHQAWCSPTAQVKLPYSTSLDQLPVISCFPHWTQPAGGEGDSGNGCYGTLTTSSLVDIYVELIGWGLNKKDVLCDIGAGIGG